MGAIQPFSSCKCIICRMNENIPCARGHSSATNDGLLIRLTPQICGGAEAKFQSSVPYTGILFFDHCPFFWPEPGFAFLIRFAVVAGMFSSESIGEVFGKASGIPEAFPNTSRRNPEDNRLKTRWKNPSGFSSTFNKNLPKENYRIRYRTLKFRFRMTAYLWRQPLNYRYRQAGFALWE